MTSNMALMQLNSIERALAQAKTIVEVITVRNGAEAARQCFRLAEYGLEMQNDAAEVKLRAERRAGEMLAGMEKNKGRLFRGDTMAPRVPVSTLTDLGINKQQSSRWQQEASVPQDRFERHVAETKAAGKELTSASVLKLFKEMKRCKKRQEIAEAAKQAEQLTSEYQLYMGDFRDVCQELESVDVIITDPPYAREYLPLYEDLAKVASCLLKPGGSLVVMVGQSYLPEILALMTPHIRYHWTVSYLTPGGQSVQLWQRKVNTFWKPVLWFVNGDYEGDWIGDVAESRANDNDKRFHDWGQSESGMADLIERFSRPDDLILDPFLGAGTTCVVGVAMNRRVIGIDVDEKAVEATKGRLWLTTK